MNRSYWTLPLIGSFCCLTMAQNKEVMYGDVSIREADIRHPVKVVGRARITDSTFTSLLSIIGSLYASGSVFEGDISVVGSDLILDKDIIHGNLHITNYLKKPVVKLNGSTIHGKVIFHSWKPGSVVADSASRVESGIENGEMSS